MIEKKAEAAWFLEAFEGVIPTLANYFTFLSLYKMGVNLSTSWGNKNQIMMCVKLFYKL